MAARTLLAAIGSGEAGLVRQGAVIAADAGQRRLGVAHDGVERATGKGLVLVAPEEGVADQPAVLRLGDCGEGRIAGRAAVGVISAEGGGAGLRIIGEAAAPSRDGKAALGVLAALGLLGRGLPGAVDQAEIGLPGGCQQRGIAGDVLLVDSKGVVEFPGFVAGAALLFHDGCLAEQGFAIGGQPRGKSGAIGRRDRRQQRAVALLRAPQDAGGEAGGSRGHGACGLVEFGLALQAALVEALLVVEGVLPGDSRLVGGKLGSGLTRAGAGHMLALADPGVIVWKTGHGGPSEIKNPPEAGC